MEQGRTAREHQDSTNRQCRRVGGKSPEYFPNLRLEQPLSLSVDASVKYAEPSLLTSLSKFCYLGLDPINDTVSLLYVKRTFERGKEYRSYSLHASLQQRLDYFQVERCFHRLPYLVTQGSTPPT